MEYLEKQLAQEHQLRKAADSYLLKLQTARQHTVGCMDSVKDAQHNVNKHTKAVRYRLLHASHPNSPPPPLTMKVSCG